MEKNLEYTFELTEEQQKKYEEWKESLPEINDGHFGAAGGGYWFKFIPTGLGVLVFVGRYDVPEMDINLTEYEYF